ncbi:MAG TPA: rod shape-determining protein MreC [Verrucomicrobiae bacterium]|nr:rod shape-determining protein MreC [Verrucomicrobiae bacterium]
MRFIYNKTFIRFFVAFVLLSGFIVADALGYLGIIKDVFFKTYGGATQFVGNISNQTKDIVRTLGTIKSLARENAELNQKIDELSFENARLQQARQENLTLRRALSFDEKTSFGMVAAEAKFLDPTGFTRTITINKGLNHGIEFNEAVIVAPGLLVGKVTKIYPDSAEVTLITDPSITINGEVPDSGARGLVKGEHGLGLMFDLVTQNELIKSGDQIMTSGLGNDFPAGLLVGEIVAIKSSTSDLFQKAFVSPAADLRNLKFLFVIQ